MRHGKTVTLILSESDFDFLQSISDRFGVKKSEFLRLFIQGLKVSEATFSKQGTKVEVGGYGIEFSPEHIESFVKQLEAVFEGFSENVKVTPIKTPQKPKKRRIKPFTKVA
jgi:hypothetical protein